MAEDMNVEIAHTLHEQSLEKVKRQQRKVPLEVLELVEGIMLAAVAIATALSGYQAARWDSINAILYGEANKYRVTADQLATEAGQRRLYDIVTFNTWIQAKSAGEDKLAALYARRFTPEFRVAFDAWLKTDPSHNPHAPPGPTFMPEYHNPLQEQATTAAEQSSTAFAQGTTTRQRGDQFVLNTVLLAAVLFLVAIGQRFRIMQVRLAVLVVACLLLVAGLHAMANDTWLPLTS